MFKTRPFFACNKWRGNFYFVKTYRNFYTLDYCPIVTEFKIFKKFF